ncbi:TPA: DUF87 domain-containing protein [Streptococcus suis]|uniref:VirB4-like conjugal transfer ATPase, CD1110 family n=1 Tax=Streptococcus suis TaxID=1307 RepID=UPI00209AB630|nr:DUF87 domain-containing protein [Streptococcus suis]MCO8218386.1 DUF87 domain-containing protein [Streptococcus suis]HEM3467936.1 DUF87 domain-containing protein [Streptococcus suis]HEM3478647.1 DUF87 domain-containing protein [Streptococcus suis]
MILFKKKQSEKLTPSEKERRERLRRQLRPTTQNTLLYTSLFEEGLMHIVDDHYSATYQLGDISYSTAEYEDRLRVAETHAKAINTLDAGSTMQLLIVNKRVPTENLNRILFREEGDKEDVYRREYNELIADRFDASSNNFEVFKYITLTSEAQDRKQAYQLLHDAGTTMTNTYKQANISLVRQTGQERMSLLSSLLQDTPCPYDFSDVRLSGLTTKDFVAPSYLVFDERSMRIDQRYAKVLYIRHYPKTMEDDLVKELTSLGIELAISIHARAVDTWSALEEIEESKSQANLKRIRATKTSASKGYYLDGETKADEDFTEADRWRKEVKKHDQKIFKGLITVFFKADSQDELAHFKNNIEIAGRKVGVRFEELHYYQEEALNTVLPIGMNYLDLDQTLHVHQRFPRSMTTNNVATQIPFTAVDVISSSPEAQYYGQNQLSNNMITIDRKKDLNTPSGVILGKSGSGKSTTAKAGEIIPTILRRPKDKVYIIDPENEYSDIGAALGAEMIDIAIGSPTHINLMDIPDKDKLSQKDRDPEGDKANFLISLFSSLLQDMEDEAISLIDRVTRLAYEQFERPTLKEWHQLMKEQSDDLAHTLATKLEIYTTGSYDIFAKETNVNLDSRFIIFNLQNLTGKLKQFGMMVLQDFIWTQVVNAREEGITIWLYYDEIQLYFADEVQATYFNHMWSRIRKYGCIPTGITQMPETLTESPQGRKLLGNSDFKILLKLDGLALQEVKKIAKLTDEQVSYIEFPKAKGTGLIVAGSTVVPFENPIPEDSQLFKLISTDA